MNAMQSDEMHAKPITLTASDGYRLAATRFELDGPLFGHLIVAGATGVPQRFYHRFARYVSGKGFSVLTLDYRGIGESKPPTLKGFKADFLDWAELDLAAAVDAMSGKNVPLFMVGHSFGGQALGLLPNHQHIAGYYTFATGAGWHGWMPFPENLRVRLLWNILPIISGLKGYSPLSVLRVGEDLPLGVYRQWRRWCRYPHYFFDDPEMAHVAEKYARVRTPMAAANALDDLWSLPRSRDAFMQAYTNVPLLERIDLDPGKGYGRIGHMGYFRAKAQPLWDKVVEWFCQLGSCELQR